MIHASHERQGGCVSRYHGDGPGPLLDRAAWHGLGATRMTPWGPLQWLAPGVFGVTGQVGAELVVYWAESVRPGVGDVGRWMDRLPCDRVVVLAAVVNGRISEMAARRGFLKDKDADDWRREIRPAAAPLHPQEDTER